MAKHLSLSILTPDKVLFEDEVSYLSVPGTAGYMGILVDHAPIISSLAAGNFLIRPVKKTGSISFRTSKTGLLQVQKNEVSILLDAADSNALASTL